MGRRKQAPTPDKPFAFLTATLNYNDPYQRQLIEHVWQHSNVSAYLTRLIQRDFEGLAAPQKQIQPGQIFPPELDDMNMLSVI